MTALSGHAVNQVFAECEACGHPKLSHSAGRCFCGCAGPRQAPPPQPVYDPVEVEHETSNGHVHGDGWSHQEDELLEERFRHGAPISQLSDLHRRRPGAILTRLEQLGLTEPRRRAW